MRNLFESWALVFYFGLIFPLSLFASPRLNLFEKTTSTPYEILDKKFQQAIPVKLNQFQMAPKNSQNLSCSFLVTKDATFVADSRMAPYHIQGKIVVAPAASARSSAGPLFPEIPGSLEQDSYLDAVMLGSVEGDFNQPAEDLARLIRDSECTLKENPGVSQTCGNLIGEGTLTVSCTTTWRAEEGLIFAYQSCNKPESTGYVYCWSN